MDDFIAKLKSISTRFNGSESLFPDKRRYRSRQGRANSSRAATENENRLSLNLQRSPLPDSPSTPSSDNAPPPSEQPPRRRRPLHRRPLFWFCLVFGSGTGAFLWGYWEVDRSLPDTASISSFVRDGTLTIKAADGSVLQQLGPATRDKVPIQRIPQQITRAFIAAEDRRFYQHSGVDYQAIIRAVATNLVAGDVVEGGSTITQQLARIVFLTQERSLWRKVQEAVMAQKIERNLSKEQVMEKYLNFVYLGSSAYGVADAAWVYFSKTVDQLTLPEIATIAGLPPAPSDYSPLVNPDLAKERRNVVLARMQEAGFITPSEAVQASTEPLKLKPSLPKKLYSDTPYFTSYVQQQLPKLVSKEQLEAGGLTVETTLNPRWQKAAEKAVLNAVTEIGPYEGFTQASLVAIDPKNGEIRAMVGGTDFTQSQFNRATQAQRQPGSAFKAILYTTAIATGMSPYDGYLDAPYSVDGYQPQNYGRKYNGWMNLREALTNSVNVISVKLIVDVGFDPVLQMAKNMGIKSKLLPTYSLALGASEVNLLELTSSYGTLAANGKHTDAHGIRRILTRNGEVLYDANFKTKQVVDPGTVAIMTWMMENVVNSGTGRAAQIGRPVAGKTGTSEEARDLWFVGFIPQVVTGVWLGNDDNSPTWSASSTAAFVWHEFMTAATVGLPVRNFPNLPTLDGRKGSIKAKAVSPRRAYTTSDPGSSNSGSSSSGSYDRPNNKPAEDAGNNNAPAPANEAPADSPPAPATPAAPPESPPVEPAPAPPPDNTAPPELPPADVPPPASSSPAPAAPAN